MTIITECNKLTQTKHKTKHDSELFKRLKSDHTAEWYIHNLESLFENKMRKILWEFQIQTDPPILATRPDLMLINKKNKKELAFGWILPKIKENKNKNLDFIANKKKCMKRKGDGATN